MNILLIIKNFDLGGSEVHVRGLANSLYEAGHNVHVASNVGQQIELLIPEVIHHTFNFSELQFIGNLRKLLQIIEAHEIDIIHGHQRMAITLAAFAGKIKSIPSIATIHGQLKYDIRSRLIQKLLSHIIAVAPHRLSHLKQNHPLLAKSSIIYNSVNVDQCYKNNKEQQSFKILYLSRLDRKHGHVIEELITYALPLIKSHYPDIELLIAGTGEHLNKIQHTIEHLSDPSLKKQIKLLGYTDNAMQEMSQVDLVLGVGRVAIESLYVGTPVIAVNSKFCGELITLENYASMKFNNFVPREQNLYSIKVLSQQILYFFKNRTHILLEQQQLTNQVGTEFSKSQTLKETLLVYEKQKKLVKNLSPSCGLLS